MAASAARCRAEVAPTPSNCLVLKIRLERATTVPMKHILLVDDEPNFLDAMQRCFRPYRQEWTLTTAGNGHEAMALVCQYPFDIVITDILMPEKEGLETIRELRKSYPWIQIIAISGGGRLVGTNVLHCARRLGARQVFEKPFEPEALVKAVRALLTVAADSGSCPACRM